MADLDDESPEDDGEPLWTYPSFSLLRLLMVILNISAVLAVVRLGLVGAVRLEIAVSLAYAVAVLPWFLWRAITAEWSLSELLVIGLIGALLGAASMPAIL